MNIRETLPGEFDVIKVDGRYPAAVKLDPAQIVATAIRQDGELMIRLDDTSHPDFWLEIRIALEQTLRSPQR